MTEPVRDLDGVVNWLTVAYNLRANRQQRVCQLIQNALYEYYRKRGEVRWPLDPFFIEDDVLAQALKEYAEGPTP